MRPRTACLVLASLLAGASAMSASPAAASGRSPYPAGATRPSILPRASDFARTPAQSGAVQARARSAASRPARGRHKPRTPVLRGNAARALVAYEAMQKHYYLQGSGLYSGEPFSYLWPFSQAFAATISLAHVPRVPVSVGRELKARLVGLDAYLDRNNSGAPEGLYTSTLAGFDGTVAPPAGPGGTKYYDDNDWIGIELVRAYRLTHDPAVLASAEAVMAFEMAGWDVNAEHVCPGGIPFSNSTENNDRNTVTTAPAAELGAQLYRVSGKIQYLQFAVKAYEWVRHCLLAPSGLYADHISPKGTIEPMIWSYNQGTMIGAGTLLYQATGNSGYLYDARQTARAALAYFTPERLGSEIPFFPSVYFRNVLYLDSVTHDPPGKRLAQAYVDYAWQHLRLANNLFVSGSPPSAQLLVQAAIAQTYALLASPASTYF
ncbi:MAG TPA: glycoside hydrolase family 76 protein [Solirubrobacteraceae bacterium]|nr:glycoside hydrolase family 76 protein [Solirubrobacteraceae bacterium]